MRRILFGSALLAVVAASGWGMAQTVAPPAKAPAPVAAHDHGDPGKAAGGSMCGGGMMGGGMMGGGMMGGGMMGGGGMGPMMLMSGPGTKVAVKNVDKGVTITLTSPDAATAVRLQKMAEAMRLMHEAMGAEK